VRRVKGRGKEANKDEGKRKRVPKDLAPGIDWPNTRNRLCAEMAKIYCDQLTGEVTNPEMAYARFTKFAKEDLYLSVSDFFYCDRDHHLTNLFIWCQPLVVKPLGERPSRDLEQYLIAILNELRPRIGGQKKGAKYMLERGKRVTHPRVKFVSTKPCPPQLQKNSRMG